MKHLFIFLMIALVLTPGCGGSGAPTTQPSSAAPATPLPDGGTLGPGRYALDLADMRITFEAEGWEGWKYGVVAAEGAGPPTGRAVGFWDVDEVYTDSCRWNRGLPKQDLSWSVQDLAVALAAQRHHPSSQPTPVTIRGSDGLHLRMRVPDDLDITQCWNGEFHFWSAIPIGGRYEQDAGRIDELWILDVDGRTLVIDAAYFPTTSATDRAELMAIVESVTIP